LIVIKKSDADAFLKALHAEGISTAAIIGMVREKGSGLVHIKTTNSREIPAVASSSTAEKSTPVKQQSSQAPVETTDEEVACCADAEPSAAGAVEGSKIAQIKARFTSFLGAASSPHGLDAYTKQAMAIALSVATRCEPCLKMHLEKAKEKGFTQDEIDEAAWMGISFAGSPAMVFYEQNKGK